MTDMSQSNQTTETSKKVEMAQQKEPVTITPGAREYLIDMLKYGNYESVSGPDRNAVHFGVDGGGCAGYQYFWNPLTNDELEDMKAAGKFESVIELDGTYKLAVDKPSLMFVLGSVIDYKKEFAQSGLVVENPLASSSCGCGTSVAFDPTQMNL